MGKVEKILEKNIRWRRVLYSPVRIRRGVFNRRGGSGKISKMLQEGGHFLIGGGSDKGKMLQEGALTHFMFL